MINSHHIKAAVFDLDKTLINDNLVLGDLTKELLLKYHNLGIKLGIASGRSLPIQVINIYKDLGLPFQFDFLIGMNGGELKDCLKNTFEKQFSLSKETVKDIVESMSVFNVNPLVYDKDGILCGFPDSATAESVIRHNTKLYVADNVSQIWDNDRAKIMFRLLDEKDMPMIEEYLNKHSDKRFAFFKTKPNMIEFQDPRINKGVALKRYCELNEIDLTEVAAFGDTTNDNELLEVAGFGVCMKNGSEDTKAVADIISDYDNNEDGALRALSKLLES